MTLALRGHAARAPTAVGLRGLAFFALQLTACSDAPSDWPSHLQEKSAHFKYWVRDDDSGSCAGITEDLERHRATLLTYLQGTGGEETIDYYKFRDPKDLAAHGPCNQRDDLVVQCQRDHRLFAHELMQQHELVHAYTMARGRSARFLDEGLAEALSCGLASRSATEVSLPELLAWSSPDDGALAVQDSASIFVAHLLRVGEPSAFLELHSLLEPGANAEQVEAAFQKVYSTSAEELYQAAQHATRADVGCVRAWECSGPEWDTSQPGYQYQSACGQPSFTSFEAVEPSLFVGATAQLQPCDAESFSPNAPSPLALPVAVGLQAGRYVLGLFGDPLRSPEPSTVPGALYPLADVVGPDASCASLQQIDAPLSSRWSFEPRTLAPDAQGSVVVRWSDATMADQRELVEAQGLQLSVAAECSEGLEMWVCDGCNALDTCSPLCEASGRPADAAPLPLNPVWRFDWPPESADTVLTVALSISTSLP